MIRIILFSLLMAPLYLHANDSVLTELKNKVQIIEDKRCPKNHDIDDPRWVKQKLSCLVEVDQYVITYTVPELNRTEFDAYLPTVIQKNTNALKEILAHHGWITISKFGKKADGQAWLLVQHADHDPAFQASIAFLLAQLMNTNETDSKNYAYLYDRVALKYQHLGLKQRYGTQYTKINNDLILRPYEGTIEELKHRREQIGLELLEQYLNRGKAMYLTFAD